jgi:hypothetical protein
MLEKEAITENLILVGFSKQKGTDAQPGWKLKLNGLLPAGAVTPGNEKDPLPKHGILKVSSRNLFDGLRSVTMTGKLKITRNAAQKDTPAYQTWEFRSASALQLVNATMLLELAMQNGDEDGAAVEVEFSEKSEEPTAPKVSDGPELFSDEDGEESPEEEIARIKGEADPLGEDKSFDDGEGDEAKRKQTLAKGEFQAEAEKKGRKRKVTA